MQQRLDGSPYEDRWAAMSSTWHPESATTGRTRCHTNSPMGRLFSWVLAFCLCANAGSQGCPYVMFRGMTLQQN